jgi:hypothetical protein
LNYNRYGYCLNNPFRYTDPSGELFGWDDVGVFVVGGLINWISNGCQFNGEGLSYFAVGGLSALATYYFPVAYNYINAGSAAANSIIRQGFNGDNKFDWHDIDGLRVFFDGAMGGATSVVSGFLGNKIASSTENLFKGIESPTLRNILASEMVGVPLGGMYGGLGALADNDPNTSFWDGAWSGAKQAFVTSAISGFGNAVQESRHQNVNLWTGKRTLYRAVSEAEYYDIMQNGLRPNPSGEGYQDSKLFYNSYDDAIQNTKAYDSSYGQKSIIIEVKGPNLNIYNNGYMDGFNVIYIYKNDLNNLKYYRTK